MTELETEAVHRARMMDHETTDDGVSASRKASQKAHQRLLTEIERNRVSSFECQDSCDFRSTSSVERTKAKRAYKTDMGRSFKKRHGVNEENKLDDSIKYATMNPRISSKANDPEKEKVHEGMLHKTSRGKITSKLIRDQHEPRQHRRFQLTEHSLEYSQLLQRVCDNS